MSTITSEGYRKLIVRDHPMSDGKGYVYEHRLLMARHLGRMLSSDELVHHRDGDKLNNSIDNLELTNRAEHVREHLPRKGTGQLACQRGHPRVRRRDGSFRCRTCENAAERRRYHEHQN